MEDDHTPNQVLTPTTATVQMQYLDLLQQVDMASGTSYKAIELENVFFSTPTRKERGESSWLSLGTKRNIHLQPCPLGCVALSALCHNSV